LGMIPAFTAIGVVTTRPIWGISKIQVSPSWLAICKSAENDGQGIKL